MSLGIDLLFEMGFFPLSPPIRGILAGFAGRFIENYRIEVISNVVSVRFQLLDFLYYTWYKYIINDCLCDMILAQIIYLDIPLNPIGSFIIDIRFQVDRSSY